MKIENLVKNFEQNTEKQSKIMSEQMQSVIQQHLTSYNELLSKNRQQTEKILSDHLQLIESHRNDLSKTLNYKMVIGGIMGLLLATMLGLGIFNLWLAKNIRTQQAQLAEIRQNIDQSPLQAKALAKVDLEEEKGVIYIANKKGTKAETYPNKDKQIILKIK